MTDSNFEIYEKLLSTFYCEIFQQCRFQNERDSWRCLRHRVRSRFLAFFKQMKTYENENQIDFESKSRFGTSELSVFSHDDGDFAFDTENTDGDKATVILTKEDAKELIEFLQSKI